MYGYTHAPPHTQSYVTPTRGVSAPGLVGYHNYIHPKLLNSQTGSYMDTGDVHADPNGSPGDYPNEGRLNCSESVSHSLNPTSPNSPLASGVQTLGNILASPTHSNPSHVPRSLHSLLHSNDGLAMEDSHLPPTRTEGPIWTRGSMDEVESQSPVDAPTAQIPLLPVEKRTKDDGIEDVRNIRLDLAVNGFSPKAIDPSKGPVGSQSKKKGKDGVKWWHFKNLSHSFPSDSSLLDFKTSIFNKVEGLKAGLGSILRTADLKKLVQWQIYIVGNYRWGKGREIMLDSDDQLNEYFKDTLEHVIKPRGLIVTMVQQSGAGIDEEVDLALEQHCLMAKNAELGLNTSVSELVDLTPRSVELDFVNKLQIKYSTAVSNGSEVFRVYNKKENITQFMQLTHSHIVDWARELAKGTPNVDLDSPPTHLPGFQWESLKRSLTESAPKGPKKFERIADYGINSLKTISNPKRITRNDLSKLMPFPPLHEYLTYCNVPDSMTGDILAILEAHGIGMWTSFLKAHWLDPERLEKWGISYGIGMELMDNATVYYEDLMARAGLLKQV